MGNPSRYCQHRLWGRLLSDNKKKTLNFAPPQPPSMGTGTPSLFAVAAKHAPESIDVVHYDTPTREVSEITTLHVDFASVAFSDFRVNEHSSHELVCLAFCTTFDRTYGFAIKEDELVDTAVSVLRSVIPAILNLPLSLEKLLLFVDGKVNPAKDVALDRKYTRRNAEKTITTFAHRLFRRRPRLKKRQRGSAAQQSDEKHAKQPFDKTMIGRIFDNNTPMRKALGHAFNFSIRLREILLKAFVKSKLGDWQNCQCTIETFVAHNEADSALLANGADRNNTNVALFMLDSDVANYDSVRGDGLTLGAFSYFINPQPSPKYQNMLVISRWDRVNRTFTVFRPQPFWATIFPCFAHLPLTEREQQLRRARKITALLAHNDYFKNFKGSAFGTVAGLINQHWSEFQANEEPPYENTLKKLVNNHLGPRSKLDASKVDALRRYATTLLGDNAIFVGDEDKGLALHKVETDEDVAAVVNEIKHDASAKQEAAQLDRASYPEKVRPWFSTRLVVADAQPGDLDDADPMHKDRAFMKKSRAPVGVSTHGRPIHRTFSRAPGVLPCTILRRTLAQSEMKDFRAKHAEELSQQANKPTSDTSSLEFGCSNPFAPQIPFASSVDAYPDLKPPTNKPVKKKSKQKQKGSDNDNDPEADQDPDASPSGGALLSIGQFS